MSNNKENLSENDHSKAQASSSGAADSFPPRKGPLSCLSGAITSGLLAWLCLGLSQKMVEYFTIHTPHYSSAIAQSFASGFKTLVIGMSFLATFTFAFIGMGVTLVFIRSLFDGNSPDAA